MVVGGKGSELGGGMILIRAGAVGPRARSTSDRDKIGKSRP